MTHEPFDRITRKEGQKRIVELSAIGTPKTLVEASIVGISVVASELAQWLDFGKNGPVMCLDTLTVDWWLEGLSHAINTLLIVDVSGTPVDIDVDEAKRQMARNGWPL